MPRHVHPLPIVTWLLASWATLAACTHSSDKPFSLYRQRIPQSPLVIYKFAYRSDFSFTENFTGLAVLDSSTPLTRDNIRRLPTDYFSARPTADLLQLAVINPGAATPADTLMTPIDNLTKTIDGVRIHLTVYNPTYGSATFTGYGEYQFDSCSETADSLKLYNVVKKFGTRDFPPTVAFVKGDIQVTSAGDTLKYIDIEQLIIQRGDIYKPGKPLDPVPNAPIVGFTTYQFYPKTVMNSSRLTDNGIFKMVP